MWFGFFSVTASAGPCRWDPSVICRVFVPGVDSVCSSDPAPERRDGCLSLRAAEQLSWLLLLKQLEQQRGSRQTSGVPELSEQPGHPWAMPAVSLHMRSRTRSCRG